VNVSEVAPQSLPDVPGSGRGAKFPRSVRLLRHTDFEQVYKQGKRYFAAHMTVFYLHRMEGNGPRVGFTVGKVLGTAVERNRVRRRLREAVRLHHRELDVPVDVVINPKKSARKADFLELGSEISRAFELIGKSIREKTTT
jgi:ribonuclease P protein component